MISVCPQKPPHTYAHTPYESTHIPYENTHTHTHAPTWVSFWGQLLQLYCSSCYELLYITASYSNSWDVEQEIQNLLSGILCNLSSFVTQHTQTQTHTDMQCVRAWVFSFLFLWGPVYILWLYFCFLFFPPTHTTSCEDQSIFTPPPTVHKIFTIRRSDFIFYTKTKDAQICNVLSNCINIDTCTHTHRTHTHTH